MNSMKKAINIVLSIIALSCFIVARDSTSGSIKGKVRSYESEKTIAGVSVIVFQEEREIKTVVTDRKGEFLISGLPPGLYTLKFRKPGLGIGTIEKIEVKPGKTVTLRDRILLPVDSGSFAYIRGSVFSSDGISIKGAKVELKRIESDGNTKDIDSTFTDISGSFNFRLPPNKAKYQVKVEVKNSTPLSKEVEVEGAAIHRVSFLTEVRKMLVQ
jgi:hypothetical protein